MFRWTGLAFKNLFKNRMRTILTILSISLSVALIFSIQIANEGIKVSVDKEAASILGENDVHISVPSYSTNLLDAESINLVANMENVHHYSGRLQGYVAVQVEDSEKQILVRGHLDEEQESGYEIVTGQDLGSENDGILLHNEFANKYNLDVGDRLILTQNERSAELEIQGIITSKGELSTGVSAIVSNPTIQELLMVEAGFNFIAVDLVDASDTGKFIDEIKTMFPEGTTITDQSIVSRDLQSSFEDLQSGFIFLTMISIFLGGFIIYHTFHVIVNHRTKDIGTLRALGASKRTITRMFLTESMVVGIIGVLVGLGFGLGLGYGLMNYFTSSMGLSEFQFSIPILGAVLASGIGLLVSFVSSLLPALQAGKKQPVEAFESAHFHIDQPNKKRPILKPIIGMVILAMGTYSWVRLGDSSNQMYLVVTLLIILVGIVLFIPIVIFLLLKLAEKIMGSLFGLQGKLATLTLSRSKERATGALTLVIITLTTVLGITIISHSVEKGWVDQYQHTFDFEIIISPDEETAYLEKGLEEEMTGITGSGMAVPYHVLFEEDEQVGQTIAIYGAKLSEYFQMKKLITPSGYAEPNQSLLEEDSGIAISENIAESLGIGIGDTYELQDGESTVALQVAAVYEEINAGGFSITIPQHIMNEVYAPYGPSGYFVKIDTELTTDKEWLNAFESASWSAGMNASTIQDELKQIKNLIGQMFIPFKVINIVIIIIAILGIANSLLISIMERKREFGLLRSVGADKPQLNQLISLEGSIIGLLGLVVGIPFGLFVGFLITYWWNQSVDSNIVFQLPLEWIIIGGIMTLLITLLVSLLTARKVYQHDIVEAFK